LQATEQNNMPLRIFRLMIVVSLFLGVVPAQPVGAATPGSEAFDQAVKAFRAGDYPAALTSFLEARRVGMDTQGLRYNLGATYYRLQLYPEAEGEFQSLAGDPEWAPVAYYNLGLTAQRMGREEQAIKYFERAYGMTDDPNLRALAGTALERLGHAPLLPRSTGSVVSLAGGYDSNVTLAQDAATLGSSNKSDFFAEALAAASRRLAGNTARGSYADGGLVLRKYGDLDQYDLVGLRGGLSYRTDSGRLQTSAGGYFDMIYVGGERLEQDAVVDVQVRSRLDAGGDLRGRYQLARIDGGGGFDYLDGWQHRFTADAGFASAPARARVGYQLELNNRRDLQQGGEFFSYSPTRHSLFVTAILPRVGGWWTDVRGEYRISRYNDPYRLNGGSLEVTRDDDRYGVALRANRRLTALWRVFIDYSNYRNESSITTYDYIRYQLLVGIEAALEK
jgi:tetratricopeptide (TPR) repeat protein